VADVDAFFEFHSLSLVITCALSKPGFFAAATRTPVVDKEVLPNLVAPLVDNFFVFRLEVVSAEILVLVVVSKVLVVFAFGAEFMFLAAREGTIPRENLFAIQRQRIRPTGRGAHSIIKGVFEFPGVALVLFQARFVLVFEEFDGIPASIDLGIFGISENPLVIEWKCIGGEADGQLLTVFAVAWRRWIRCFRFGVVAKGCHALEIVAHGGLDPIGTLAGTCINARISGQAASIRRAPRGETDVDVNDRTIVSNRALDEGTTRVSEAGALSTLLEKPGTKHDVRDGSVVGGFSVAILVADVGVRCLEEDCWKVGKKRSRRAQSHNLQVIADARNRVVLVDLDRDAFGVHLNELVELAQGKIVVGILKKGGEGVLHNFRKGIGDPFLAKANLGSLGGGIGRVVGANDDLLASIASAFGRKENGIGGDQGSSASEHVDKIGIVTRLGLLPSNDTSGGGFKIGLFSFHDTGGGGFDNRRRRRRCHNEDG